MAHGWSLPRAARGGCCCGLAAKAVREAKSRQICGGTTQSSRLAETWSGDPGKPGPEGRGLTVARGFRVRGERAGGGPGVGLVGRSVRRQSARSAASEPGYRPRRLNVARDAVSTVTMANRGNAAAAETKRSNAMIACTNTAEGVSSVARRVASVCHRFVSWPRRLVGGSRLRLKTVEIAAAEARRLCVGRLSRSIATAWRLGVGRAAGVRSATWGLRLWSGLLVRVLCLRGRVGIAVGGVVAVPAGCGVFFVRQARVAAVRGRALAI